jgi:hypothetical protein
MNNDPLELAEQYKCKQGHNNGRFCLCAGCWQVCSAGPCEQCNGTVLVCGNNDPEEAKEVTFMIKVMKGFKNV